MLKNSFVLIISMIVSVATVLFCGYSYIDLQMQSTVASSRYTTAEKEEESSSYKETGQGEEVVSSSSEVSDSAESVEVGGSAADAVGKIYEQVISPYSAALSYNNVYVKNTSGASVDLKSELDKGSNIKIEKNGLPQVLIVHTHATESFMSEERDYYTTSDNSRSTDNSKNVTRLGEILAKTLNDAGITTLHDKTQHDYPSYTGSYTRSAKTVKEYLDKYPSIKIVIDLHRDSIALEGSDRAKPTVTVDGKKAAQIMLCMGSQTGTVTGYPNWRENFRLAAEYQQTVEAIYPGLARAMLLRSSKYNQNLSSGSILLEIGTESNTLAEAEYSASLAGKALVNLLNTMV